MSSRRVILRHWVQAFTQAGIDSPELSAQLLLAHVLGLTRLDVLLDLEAEVAEQDAENMRVLSERRRLGEPVAYLLGRKEFYGLEFALNNEVLIPRPETELLIDHLLDVLDRHAGLTLLDVGTGSGILAVTCALLFPNFRIIASDVNGKALQVAKSNACRHHVRDRILFVQADLVEALHIGEVDALVANLPYVPDWRRADMSAEVLGYEPRSALFAGPDGLDCYRALARALSTGVMPGTTLVCEVDSSQGRAMTALFRPVARSVRVERDLAGLDRIAVVVF